MDDDSEELRISGQIYQVYDPVLNQKFDCKDKREFDKVSGIVREYSKKVNSIETESVRMFGSGYTGYMAASIADMGEDDDMQMDGRQRLYWAHYANLILTLLLTAVVILSITMYDTEWKLDRALGGLFEIPNVMFQIICCVYLIPRVRAKEAFMQAIMSWVIQGVGMSFAISFFGLRYYISTYSYSTREDDGWSFAFVAAVFIGAQAIISVVHIDAATAYWTNVKAAANPLYDAKLIKQDHKIYNISSRIQYMGHMMAALLLYEVLYFALRVGLYENSEDRVDEGDLDFYVFRDHALTTTIWYHILAILSIIALTLSNYHLAKTREFSDVVQLINIIILACLVLGFIPFVLLVAFKPPQQDSYLGTDITLGVIGLLYTIFLFVHALLITNAFNRECEKEIDEGIPESYAKFVDYQNPSAVEPGNRRPLLE